MKSTKTENEIWQTKHEPGQQGNAGMRRTWFYACHEENVAPHKPAYCGGD